MLSVVAFAYTHYHALLQCLNRSIDDPTLTRLTIQNITFLMRVHKSCRLCYATASKFKEWQRNPNNPLYSLDTVEGLLLIDKDDDDGDIFLPEVQQFIYYIGDEYWPFPEEGVTPRVSKRFHKIWGRKTEDRPPAVPFHDPVERWFSDRESEHSDGDDEDDDGEDDDPFGSFDEYLMNGGSENDDDDGQSIELFDEPETITPEVFLASLNAAEEAGLRSQDRRLNARRMAQRDTFQM